MANADTTRTSDGKLFQRQHVIFQATGQGSNDVSSGGMLGGTFASTLQGQLTGISTPSATQDQGGVEIAGIVTDRSDGLRRYDPQHPDADKDGYVTYPDIDPLTEMVDLMGATRAYGLNVSAIQATKTMIGASLDLLK
jgi:flagellar basal-body rod protein FlgC